ncbi:PorV/PorQ family protein [Gracilimonas sp.]|uniref:PorV/PorQ family protein n=1 Tax=Gracilimonas sp. TaxID=1974203 RepID=UPI0032EC8A0E
MKFSLFFILLLYFSHFNVLAQVAVTAVPFLQVNNDARSIGLAGSNVAMNNFRNGIHLNPATFGKANTLEFSSQFGYDGLGTQWLPAFNADDLKFYTPQLIAGFDKLSIGFQYTYFDLGNQFQTDQTGNIEDVFQPYERAHTISVSYDITPHFSAGTGINFIRSSLVTGTTVGGQEVEAASQTTWDLGLYGEYPFQTDFAEFTPSIGWSITDIGNPIRYVPTSRADPLPITMRGGLGFKVDFTDKPNTMTILSMSGYLSLSKTMARIKEDGSPMKPLEAIFNSWDEYTRFNGMEFVTLSLKDQLMRHSGLEITFLEIISARFGHFYEHPMNGDRNYNTIGVGLHYKYFTFDYARLITDETDHPLQNTQHFQFSVSVPF